MTSENAGSSYFGDTVAAKKLIIFAVFPDRARVRAVARVHNLFIDNSSDLNN
jgi:hypothetical protein